MSKKTSEINQESRGLTNEKNQFIFCGLGFFWVSNIGPLLAEKTFFLRLLIYPICILSIVLFARLLFCFRKNKPYIDNTAYSLLLCLSFLSCVSVARGIPLSMDIDKSRTFLFDLSQGAIAWLIPLSIFFSVKGRFWMTWLPKLRPIVFFGLLYAFTLFFINFGLKCMFDKKLFNACDLLFMAPFLLIWSRFKKDSADLLLGSLGVVVIVIWMFILNERFAIAYTGLMCLFYLFSLFFEKYNLNLKINLLSLGLASTIIISVLFLQTPSLKPLTDKYIFRGGIMENTRFRHGTGGRLADAVTRDMSSFEKYFGKGIGGTYIWGEIDWPPRPYIRPGVEIGYSQLVLKGGYVMQVAFLALSLYSVYLAIFRSNNRITRYLAYIIIARLIIMITAMPPRVGFEYFMYWLVVGGCLSSELRSFSDDEIAKNCATKRIIIEW